MDSDTFKQRIKFFQVGNSQANHIIKNKSKKIDNRGDQKKEIIEKKEKKEKIEEIENENKNILDVDRKFLDKIAKLLRNILNKFNEIDPVLKENKQNTKINDLIKELSRDNIKSNIDGISLVISEKFKELIAFIKSINEKLKKNIIDKKSIEDNVAPLPQHQEKKSRDDKKEKEINLIYSSQYEHFEHIFGEKFVKNNFKNIKLFINGKESPLAHDYKLKKGNNIIKMIINNKLRNLENMFYECESLANIDELKHLDTSEVTNFSNMFVGIQSLIDTKPLENWDVSKSQNFSFMFSKCYKLLDVSSIKNWNVANCTNFSGMFNECCSLLVVEFENWNVSKSASFSNMFRGCSSLYDLKSLENWNVSNSVDLSEMFKGCYTLESIEGLRNWNVAKCKNFSEMFYGCNGLSDIGPLKNWNVSRGENFSGMLRNCYSIEDRTAIIGWNLSKIWGFGFDGIF